jgi:hypothetical protein
MSTNPFRVLCAELLQELCCHYRSWELKEGRCSDAMNRALAELAQPQGEGPSNEQMYHCALKAICRYGLDTLSGRVDGGADDREWQRAAVVEMVRRAQTALDYGSPPAPPAPEAGEVAELVAWLDDYAEANAGWSSAAIATRAATLLQQFSAITTEDLKND